MPKHFEGHIDHSGNGLIFGWVRDPNSTQERFKVELCLSNGWSKIVEANKLRKDLALADIGDGRYGFETTVPYSIANHGEITVHAHVVGHDYQLEKSGRPLQLEKPIALIAGDITNNCNLRCPFCVTDYALTRGLKSMTLETFDKALALLPQIPEGMFWLSCMHEPTIHPQFNEFINRIPLDQRKKVSFTSNLCKKFDDKTIDTLANSNIHSIRISIDSNDPERFAELRKGGRLEIFLDNLSRLAKQMENNPKAPSIHYISMVFNNNVHEIESIVRRCKSILPAGLHEVRFLFYQPHIADWGQAHLLSLEEWEKMKARIRAYPELNHVEFFDPFPDTHKAFQERRGTDVYKPSPAVFGGSCSSGNYPKANPLENYSKVPDEPLPLRMRWDGLIMHEKMPESDFLEYVQTLTPADFTKIRTAGSEGIPNNWNSSSKSLREQ